MDPCRSRPARRGRLGGRGTVTHVRPRRRRRGAGPLGDGAAPPRPAQRRSVDDPAGDLAAGHRDGARRAGPLRSRRSKRRPAGSRSSCSATVCRHRCSSSRTGSSRWQRPGCCRAGPCADRRAAASSGWCGGRVAGVIAVEVAAEREEGRSSESSRPSRCSTRSASRWPRARSSSPTVAHRSGSAIGDDHPARVGEGT